MDQTLNIDRYLNQRCGVLQRLYRARVPAERAERWVAAWEDEALRRGLDRRDPAWWRSGRQWIIQGCGDTGGSDRSLPESATVPVAVGDPLPPAYSWRNGPLAECADRVQEYLLALGDLLRRWADAAAPVMTRVAKRSWKLIATTRSSGSSSASDRPSPDYQWLQREMERLCASREVPIEEAT
jgi:hypothetical protein